MHSGLILLLWMAAVASVQLAKGYLLAALVGVSLCLVLALARTRGIRLIRRVRILLLAITVLFAWFTPGEALFAGLPGLSPTHEGVMLALEHGGRLIVVVCCVALLLEMLPPDRLVSGLHALCRPGALFGLSAQRVALRLLLVLRYVDDARGGRHEWKQWLLAPDDVVDAVHLVRERLGPLDVFILASFLVGVGWWMW